MAKVPLTPLLIDLASSVFAAITRWKFEDEFVARILADDIPQRIKYQSGAIWAYLDPDKTIVAFGTLSVCDDYAALTGGKLHTYIPLLAVHPDLRGRGYGRSVVDHLIDEAACIVKSRSPVLHHAVFLDVYNESVAALNLYTGCGFQSLGNTPFVDPLNQKLYRVMAKRVLD